MIRIDEIYKQTFWPWIQHNHPSTRMLWCEPLGHTTSRTLLSKSLTDRVDTYVFFHDQEPVNSDVYDELFASVKYRNRDIIYQRRFTEPGIVVVSEKGTEVDKVCDKYGWLSSYYFFHGWAALDRYRGYNRTFCLMDPEHRQPTKTLMYADETMYSRCRENLNQANDSLVFVSTEKVIFGKRLHLTEKTLKPIALGLPFVLVSTAGSLEYLRSYGFQSFGHIWSEDYDCETDDLARLESVAGVLKDINALPAAEKKQLRRHCLPIIKHNWNWFYGGGFEQTLWRELTDMLKQW